MDKYELTKLILMLSMLGALVVSAVSSPADSKASEQCTLFPQFVTAASSSKNASDESEDIKITYTFGITELLSRLCKA